MNISYNWLKEYLDFDLEPEEVAAALTSIGLETGGVEEVQTIKGGLEGLVIGEVLTCEEHPNSDHLHITTVNVGGEAPLQIVCGAPNVAAGQKVVVAVNGTKLYDGDECFTIKRSKIRGVECIFRYTVKLGNPDFTESAVVYMYFFACCLDGCVCGNSCRGCTARLRTAFSVA